MYKRQSCLSTCDSVQFPALVFTFPLAVLGNIGIRWAAGSGFTGWESVAWITLAVSTAAILAILGGTLRDCGLSLRRRPTRRPAAA